MRHAIFGSILLLSLLVVACGEESDSTPVPGAPSADVVTDTQVTDGDLGSSSGDASETQPCPKGQILGMDSICVTIGIPDCADLFMNADSGFCEPSIDLCDAGHYPDFETGCVQAGITDCAPEFVSEQSGLCAPNPSLCGPGFLAIPTQGCVSMDPPDGCGEGTWGSIVEDASDQHVDHAYDGGDSDGSREKPWTQISQAQANLSSEGRIILAAGDYDESVLFQSSASLIGRCSSMVTVSGATTSPVAANLGKTVLEFIGAIHVTVRDLRVSGDGVGLATYSGAQVTLERVIFDDNEFFGIFISQSGTVVTATDLVVSGTRPRADGMFGLGVSAQDGGTLNLDRGMLVDNTETNLFCGGPPSPLPSAITVKNTLVSGALAPSHGLYGGRGVAIDSGASANLESLIIRENTGSSLYATGPGTTVTANGLVIFGIDSDNPASNARGINIQEGASGQLNQVAISRTTDIGLYIANEGTSVEASGLFIQETQPAESPGEGRGVHLKDGASFSLDGGAFIANHDAGFLVRDGATATVTGLLVENTQPDTYGWGGIGIEVLTDSQLVLERSALLTNIEGGLVATNIEGGVGGLLAGTSVEVRDSIIAHTQVSADGAFGRGIQTQTGASLIVERSVIIDNNEAAIFIWEAFGDIRDTLLADTKVSGGFGAGDGLLVTMSEVTASGVVATRNGRVGVLYDRTIGEISNCSITENAFGLATQGTDVPTISDDNAVVDNTKNVVENSDLQIPDTPMVLPKEDKTSNE
jgi:hypothetical protein